MANDSLSSYLPGVLPAIAIDRHLSLALAGSLVTALLLGQVLQPLAGLWADRIGGRALVLFGPLLGAAATFGIAYGRGYPVLITALLLTGVGSTLFHPQALAAARRAAARSEGRGMSSFLVAGEAGRALAPLAAGILVARWGVHLLWALAIPVAVTWPWIWRGVPISPRGQARGARAPIPWGRRAGPTVALVSYAALRSASIYGVITFLPLLWTAQGGSLITGASMVTTLIGVGIAGNMAGGVASDRWGRLPVLGLSSLASVVLVAALTGVSGIWLFPILALAGVSLFSSLPVTMLAGQDMFPENPAFGSGMALGLGNGLGALLVLALGVFSAHAGIHAAFLAMAGGLLVSMAAVPTLARRTRPA
jgi:FSR family fosmidomycin resistance protein-like MFS transporter